MERMPRTSPGGHLHPQALTRPSRPRAFHASSAACAAVASLELESSRIGLTELGAPAAVPIPVIEPIR